MVRHIFCFFQLVRFSLCFVRPALTHTGLACHIFQNLFIMLCFSLSFQTSPKLILNDPVNLKIRITTDWRSKMAVIFRCKSKMAAAFCSILRLFHGSKSKAADLWLVWKSLNALQNSLDLFRGNLLAMLLHRHSLIMKKCEKALHFLGIRSLMGTVNKRHIIPAALLCHSLICHKHEILNDPCCHICLIWLNVNGSSCCI